MKKGLIVLSLTAMLAAGCKSRTPLGKCIGAFDTEKPGLEYQVSARNVVLGCVFFQTLFVPILVLLNQTKCPVGVKS